MFLNIDSYQNLISLSITYSDRLVPSSYVKLRKVLELSLLWREGGLFMYLKKYTVRGILEYSFINLFSLGFFLGGVFFIFQFTLLFILFQIKLKGLGFNLKISFSFCFILSNILGIFILFYGQFPQNYIYFNNPIIDLVMKLWR